MLMISPAISPPSTAPGNEPKAADHDDHEGLHQEAVAASGVTDTIGAIQHAGNARRCHADREYQQECAPNVDAQDADHGGILDAGAHHQSDRRAVKHKVKRQKCQRDDADQFQPVGRDRSGSRAA